MKKSIFSQPNAEQLKGFIDGDPVAIDEVIRHVLPQLYRWAMRRYDDLPEQEVQSVIHQVLAEVCVHHERYDSDKSSITTYVINLITKRMSDLARAYHEVLTHEDSSEEGHEKAEQLGYNPIETEVDLRMERVW